MKDERGFGAQPEEPTEHLGAVNESDAFLTALSRGEDPSRGQDPLAAALLSLKHEVDAPAPPAPEVAPVPVKSSRWKPWMHGLVGAAAATAVLTGSGALLYNSNALAPSRDESTVVELASTLEEMELKASEGNFEALHALLGEALGIIRKLESQQEDESAPAEVTTSVVTVTEEPEPQEPQPAAPAPAPERTTVTEKVTVTETVERESPTSTTTSAEPKPETTSPSAAAQ